MSETVLLTGATGFVGRHLRPALEAAGYRVRCTSRDPERAEQAAPDVDWVRLDLDDPASLAPALAGCQRAYFLIHGMDSGEGYAEREVAGARRFREAAEAAGVERLVYLGGVAPRGEPSRHLAARLATGEALRAGSLSAVELRAAMVIGEGSESWLMVTDLARRLPAMLLPRWLQHTSWPISIEDVVRGLLTALRLELPGSAVFELPGAERIRHRDLLQRVSRGLGRRPLLLDVPFVTPRLSSYWIGFVTRAKVALAKELVRGIGSDLEPSGTSLWEFAGLDSPLPLDLAFARALADLGQNDPPSRATLARLRSLGEAQRLVDPA